MVLTAVQFPTPLPVTAATCMKTHFIKLKYSPLNIMVITRDVFVKYSAILSLTAFPPKRQKHKCA